VRKREQLSWLCSPLTEPTLKNCSRHKPSQETKKSKEQ
jgi:hypothetical protein